MHNNRKNTVSPPFNLLCYNVSVSEIIGKLGVKSLFLFYNLLDSPSLVLRIVEVHWTNHACLNNGSILYFSWTLETVAGYKLVFIEVFNSFLWWSCYNKSCCCVGSKWLWKLEARILEIPEYIAYQYSKT